MSTTIVNSALFTADTSTTSDRVTSKTLTQEDFLQVLVAEATYQDPFGSSGSGGSNKDYFSDMMAMANYEAVQNSNTINQQLLSKGLVGEYVEAQGESGEIIHGYVTAAGIKEGELRVYIDGYEDQEITNNDVLGIIDPTSFTQASIYQEAEEE